MWEVVQNSASPQRPFFKASDNKTEHFLLYLEDFFFLEGGAKATHLPVVAYSSYNICYPYTTFNYKNRT